MGREKKFLSTNGRAPRYRLSADRFKLQISNALYYCAQWANSGSYSLFVCSHTTAIAPYLSGSFTKVLRARGMLAIPTLPLPKTEELRIIWEDVSDAISRTVPIFSQNILFTTNYKIS